jgi:adenylate cyclase
MARQTVSDYRARARHFAFRYPVLNEIQAQVSFWILANVLLITLISLTLHAASLVFPGVVNLPYWPQFWMAVAAGISYGILLGLIDRWMDVRMDLGCSLGVRILLKAGAYMLAFAVIIAGTVALHEAVFADLFRSLGIEMTARTRTAWVAVITLYTIVGTLLISFIKQVNRTFGPGVLLPLLLGRYRNPIEEKRIFMFMDLRASTTYAEELGHIRYSAMVRDLFRDVNQVVPKHDAEIYQYVGDEVVFTWSVADGLHDGNCVKLFYAISDAIAAKAEDYKRTYGFVPEFKAGLHVGDVTAVEIGDIKREIAYHGDTVNTASRIQGVSNEFGHEFLVSGEVIDLLKDQDLGPFRSQAVGSVLLKGKRSHVTIHWVERDPVRAAALN